MNLKILSMLFALLFIASAAVAADLRVSAANYDPTPVFPGGSFTLWIHLKNNSNTNAENAFFNLNLKQFDITGTYPFYLDSADNPTRTLGTINSAETVLVSYRVLVKPNTADGIYKVSFEIGQNGQINFSSEYSIQVLNRRPKIRIIEANNVVAQIGKNVELELLVKNTGTSNAFDLTVGLNEDRTVTSTGVVVERDIIPIGASSSSLSSINVAETAKVKLNLFINPSATPKAYFVPIKIEFYDENRTKYSDTDYIGLKVADETEIGAYLSEIKPILSNSKKSEITIDIFNNGIGSAKYLTAKVSSDILTIDQPTESFIGTMEPDDSDSIVLNAILKDSTIKPGDYSINLTIEYKNDFGDTKTVQKNLPIKVYSAEEAAKINPQQQDLGILPIIIIIVLVAGLFFWFKKKKNNNKK